MVERVWISMNDFTLNQNSILWLASCV